MPRKNPHRPFTPDPAQMALAPQISGNKINGLGEVAARPARMVYWAPDPDTIPHGAMQRWFYTVDPDAAPIRAARAERQVILAAPLAGLAPERAARQPEEWTASLTRFVEEGLCEKTGVAVMDPAWTYEGQIIPQSRVIVLGVQHDFDAISTAPGAGAGGEVIRQYGRAAGAAKGVASWLRQQGWEAEPVTGPMTGALMLIPPALACGFGELGKHGSIIDAAMGSSFRLSAVLTDAPFAPTPPQNLGVDDFCNSCRICEDACPPFAIAPDKQTVRGVEKWYVDFDRCLPFFNQTNGCAICIAVCPWSRPGVGLNLAAKLARRAVRMQGTEADAAMPEDAP
ncbi:4Fe-4S dicluster domain-containing protein [Seohaeicola saemankumensis]|uniref:4Fe-4S dicluster domain-containing protein n=1 Tax=Seohaeicola saemankumensis TaxID=481181 RepID=UPI001E41D82C|nr:4Fe-4S dicluster domain-containing protein [Seohaeicola saemankumensis]MCD1626734.1 4Fe-4S dicluster domain-containing protein [Seohaeicola saemankumensis]